jgi:long-chain acyl-CoA synthetase
MSEYSVPVAYIPQPEDNITQYVFRNAAQWPDEVGLKRKIGGAWEPVTWREFSEQVQALAAGFIGAGIGAGDRVALMSRTRYEWTLVNEAILTAGGVLVPIYPTSSVEQVDWIVNDSGAVAVVAETDEHADLVAKVRDDLVTAARVWVIDGQRYPGLTQLREQGTDVPAHQVDARRTSRGANDLAEIVYTSGTTGRPKGCMLNHRNLVANTTNCMLNDGFSKVFNEHHSTLLFLPLAHCYAQLIQYGAIYSRTVLGLADMQDAPNELPRFRPTAVLSVPRVWQKAFNTAQHQAASEGHGKIFAAAEKAAVDYSQALDRGHIGLGLRIRHMVFDRLVYKKIRAALGGRVQYAWSAAAPLGTYLGHFFRGAGINVLEGYGLTETSPATNSNTPDAQKIGSVGRPIPGCTIRIAPDQEVLIKGHMLFQGYWHNEAATREMIDDAGWLHTGDLGELDDDGFLMIIGRKKDLIITSSGKNVAPAVLEDKLRAHWLVSECMVVGDGKPFIAALVTLDGKSLQQWRIEHGKPPESTGSELYDPELIADLQHAVDDANKAVSRAESIRKFVVLPDDFTEHGGQLTPTLKVRRNVVLDQYQDVVAKLYADVSTGVPSSDTHAR